MNLVVFKKKNYDSRDALSVAIIASDIRMIEEATRIVYIHLIGVRDEVVEVEDDFETCLMKWRAAL